MKKIVRIMALALTLCLVLAMPALADMKRGDTGEAVMDLQTMLFETGFLFEEPDGQFGGHTEAAVKTYQEVNGLPQDGIVTDELLDMIYDTWLECMRDIYGQDYATDCPLYCVQWVMPDGNSQTDYCEKHLAMFYQAESLLSTGSIEDARQARQLWQDEVNALYDEWAGRLPEADRGSVVAAKALFFSAVDAQSAAMYSSVGGDMATAQTLFFESCLEMLLRNQAAWLCGILWNLGV